MHENRLKAINGIDYIIKHCDEVGLVVTCVEYNRTTNIKKATSTMLSCDLPVDKVLDSYCVALWKDDDLVVFSAFSHELDLEKGIMDMETMRRYVEKEKDKYRSSKQG